jgi:hypothetical protein
MALSPGTRSVLRSCILIFLSALAVRWSFLLLSVAFGVGASDGAEMGWVARNLYAGRGFSSPYGPGDRPTALFGPIVPLMWNAVWLVAGRPSQSLAALANCVPSALAVVLYWLIARRLTRAMQLPEWTPLSVAIVMAVWPETLFRLRFVWYYTWQAAGVAAIVWLGLRWMESARPGRALGLGMAVGLVGLINPTPLPIGAVAILAPALRERTRARVAGVAMASLAAAFVMLPWFVRNAVVLGAVVPVRSSFGIELLQGNNPRGAIRQTFNSLHPALNRNEMAAFRALGEIPYTRQATERALAYMYAHPAITGWRIAQRVYFSWVTDVTSVWRWRPTSPPWWRSARHDALLKAIVIATSPLALLFVVWGVFSGHFRALPSPELFVSIFVFMPLPYYMTSVSDFFTAIIRTWLGLLSVVLAACVLQRVRESSEAREAGALFDRAAPAQSL